MERIEDLVVPGAGQKFKGEDFRALCRPCVYLFMRAGTPLYIGMSTRGIERPSAVGHHVSEARDLCDEVLIYPCKTPESARILESLLISSIRPKYNCQTGKQFKDKATVQKILKIESILCLSPGPWMQMLRRIAEREGILPVRVVAGEEFRVLRDS